MKPHTDFENAVLRVSSLSFHAKAHPWPWRLLGASWFFRLMLALVFVIGLGVGSWDVKAVSVIAILGLTWAPAALLTIYLDEPVPPRRWRFIHLLLLGRRLSFEWERLRSVGAWRLAQGGLLIALVAAFTWMMLPIVSSPSGRPRLPRWLLEADLSRVTALLTLLLAQTRPFFSFLAQVIQIIVIILIAFYIPFLLSWVSHEMDEVAEAFSAGRWVRQWAASPPESASLVQTLSWLTKIKTARQAKRLLQVIRDKGLLDRDPDVDVLAVLIAAVEQAKRRKQATPTRHGWTGFLDELRAETSKPNPLQWTYRAVHRWMQRWRAASNADSSSPSVDQGSATARVEAWIRQLTADGWDRILILDGVCLDIMGQIVEQAHPTDTMA